MEIREVLQTEIWSKETSRKILKIFVSCVLLGVFVAALEVQWITPSERSAAKIGLASVEDLQYKSDADEDDYKKLKQKVDAKVERALNATWTLRDKKVANALYAYSILIDMQHQEPRARAAVRVFQEKHPSNVGMQSNLALEVQQDQTSQQVITFMRGVLHHALD